MLSTMIFPPAFDTLRIYPERTAEIVEQNPDEDEDDESSIIPILQAKLISSIGLISSNVVYSTCKLWHGHS